jgi:hypothetical protein
LCLFLFYHPIYTLDYLASHIRRLIVLFLSLHLINLIDIIC